PAAIDLLKANSPLDGNTFQQLLSEIPKSHIRFDEQHQIEVTLRKILPSIQLQDFECYPQLLNQSQVESKKKRLPKDTIQLLSAIGLGLIKKSTGARGVINELETLANSFSFSRPIHALLSEAKPSRNPATFNTVVAPIALSQSQEKVIESAEKYTLSLVNGPPGTGKSFTIAALATHFLAEGKSILIASKSNQAIEVIANKIEQDFQLQDIVVKAGRTNYKYALQKRLTDLRAGLGLKKVKPSQLNKLEKETHLIIQQIAALAKQLESLQKTELKRGAFLKNYDQYWFKKLRLEWLQEQQNQEVSYWEKMFELEKALAKKNEKMHQLIRLNFRFYLYRAFTKSRRTFKLLVNALSARTGTRKEKYFDQIDFRKVLEALPIWLVPASDIAQVLPFKKELFDLLIIDEASQCDIASSLPLLQRAAKVVVVGDPKQLRHLSFLSQQQQISFQQRYQLEQSPSTNLNYRDQSLIDLMIDKVHNADQVHFLAEHFRSLPDIIHFSNQYFYSGALKIMTATPQFRNKKHVFIHQCQGHRSTSGINKQEAEQLLHTLKEIVQEEHNLAIDLCQSIGLLSPFRAQVNYLQKQISEVLSPAQIERHRLLIGTPHAFQGEERDIMLLSFSLDANSHPSAFQYLEKEEVFNVSITRARSQQFLFLSIPFNQLKPTSLLAQYL
ncbi:MAG: ATP-binding protein, partial [Bacteroidota bacterium]